ncbi:MAG: membrane dipeptidase, partial [Rhodospirillales bacterium]|nr:membrane dipeptidase [Rhodospirillales bacterium]
MTDPSFDPGVAALHAEAPLTDVHVHPSLKAYLFGRDLRKHYPAGPGYNPFGTRTDWPSLQAGGVRVIWAVHYIPELPLFEQNRIVRWLVQRISSRYRGDVFRSPLARLDEMIDEFERQVSLVADIAGIARNVREIDQLVAWDRIAVVHAVEGGHVLEGNPENVHRLAARGVAYLTLTHFFPNGLARQDRAVPEDLFLTKLSPYNFGFGMGEPLTDLGKAVLREMKTAGMVLDLAHCALEARRAIYDYLRGDLMLTATHAGLTACFDQPYNFDETDIKAIAATGGAIGILFMPFHLNGRVRDEGIDAIV